ncbi:MAG TPA: Crp/Fnr family transcriptional regulator [Propionibacteriaceae bacterium]|nr:Crp/Fnr family transcriptional regulator [Propionibacteriaceae bacterium]
MDASLNPVTPLIRKLESIFTLSDDERQAVLDLPLQVMHLKADQDIVREGDRPTRSCALLDGFACTFKVTAEGKRQITAFHIPGDIPDLQSLHLEVLDTSLATLTRCKVGFIQHEALQDLCDRHPRIAKALWRETLIDAAIFREWTVNVGRREAYARIAHILCELVVRMKAVGLAEGHTVQIPITQNEFADATGLSNVHVNRVLQALRSDGLIILKGDTLQVLDWDQLKQAGDFDPTYLHLQRKQEAA